ncbi:MAG: hypothetical protein KDD41_00275 [Flavobacteriales bacterium]|nr:hypothetical protein [Flavobacteriales bacterium]
MVFKRITYLTMMLFLLACAGEARYDELITESASEMEEPVQEEVPAGMMPEVIPQELSHEEQDAYQLRAKQKFQDFCDYLKILTDKRINNDLQQHARKMIRELFVSDTVKLSGADSVFFSTTDSLTEIPLKELIDLPYETIPGQLPLVIHLKSMDFSSPLQSDSQIGYRGRLTVTFTAHQKSHQKNIDVFLVETTKQFGEYSEGTIEVKLGNIY